MAARVGIGKDAVAKIWADHNLKPWNVATFTVSNDPRFDGEGPFETEVGESDSQAEYAGSIPVIGSENPKPGRAVSIRPSDSPPLFVTTV